VAIIRPRRPTRGASLLEAIATVALSGLILSSVAATITASAAALRRQRLVAAAVGVARTRLENTIAHPCLPLEPCEQPTVCRLLREVALVPNAERPFWTLRLRSTVVTHGQAGAEGAEISLSTLVARTRPCSG